MAKQMTFDQIRQLAQAAAHNQSLTFSEESFDCEAVNAALREQFNLLTDGYYNYQRNKVEIFELISETIDDVLPAKVLAQYEQFADVKTVAQGDKAIFTLRITEAARKRAKSFVTRVGLAGRYETMILEGRQLEVGTAAIGYAVRIGFEEFLDGRYSFADFTEVMLEGMNEYIYQEIAKALANAIEELPVANKYTGVGFDEGKMDELLAISDSYGNGTSTIYCTKEFASTMKPASADWASDAMKDTLFRNGFFTDYKGHPVVILQQSMVDTTNEEKVIDPSQAYILANVGEKPVKVVFEGQTAVKTREDNDDWSTDLQTYKKFGVAVFSNPSICSYQNTSLKKATH
jgi:hypothetical protein